MAKEIRARDRDAADYFDFCRRSLGAYGDRAQIRLVLRSAGLRPHFRVLDAGCGVGRYTIPIARRTHAVLAVDFSPGSIDVLRRLLRDQGISNVESRVGDLTAVELPSNSFDVALAPAVIHHIPTAELRVKVMKKILQSLQPGGRVVLLVYRWGGNIRLPTPKEGTHKSGVYYYAYTPAEVREMMWQAGFTKIRIRGFLSLPLRVSLRLPAWMSWLEPIIAWIPLSVFRAHSLLVTAHRPLE